CARRDYYGSSYPFDYW
nr:immunoglobulin heavy chain junction region [Mus musculus]MBK4186463.1 immunoglobulin heavy chain junction region [Mus musculus]MBK4186464.1 immunoglobulin heavy chain junction region [Mus musculus]MBK4186465.1 immunoglobulin heavy chain junction region [Mus musculus]MBK4186466.1 immunoglobulin heavy chain junction region [Mus musculus]